MFEQTFPDARVETRKPAAVAASLVFQSIAMGGLLLIPLLHPELLPVTRPEQPAIWMIHHTAPEPPAPEVAVRSSRRSKKPAVSTFALPKNSAARRPRNSRSL